MIELNTSNSGHPSPGPPPVTLQPAAVGTPPSPTYAPESDVHLLDRLAVLYRYRRIAFSVFVLSSAATRGDNCSS